MSFVLLILNFSVYMRSNYINDLNFKMQIFKLRYVS